jgi:large subunit ribosomal protein L30e
MTLSVTFFIKTSVCCFSGCRFVSQFDKATQGFEVQKMDINIDKALIKAVKTGKVVIGSKKAIELSNSGDAKIIILARNCPEDTKKQIESSKVPVYVYDGTSRELGPVCGKPFIIAAMAILDVGESDILSLANA